MAKTMIKSAMIMPANQGMVQTNGRFCKLNLKSGFFLPGMAAWFKSE